MSHTMSHYFNPKGLRIHSLGSLINNEQIHYCSEDRQGQYVIFVSKNNTMPTPTQSSKSE